MKTASLKEIKTELNLLHPNRVMELCIQMAKFRKENKELLAYLLFEADNENTYIENVKIQIDELFEEINKSNIYFAKKTIRKILRNTNKYIKYSGSKQTEVELLLHFCKRLKNLGIPLPPNSALGNIYQRQLKKIHQAMATLHEDLQFDYSKEFSLINCI
ncbi:MAG: hypothetical protein HXX18_11655 [Bacteroidetes bacterium]|nr:hypothetical protein [Bacteroidota bacterium]